MIEHFDWQKVHLQNLSSLFTDAMIRKFAYEISMTKAAVMEPALLERKNAQ